MRFTSLIVAGLLALTASAQSTDLTTTTDASTATSTTSSVQATDSAQAATLKCLEACAAGDVNCQAHCITVPSPDETAVNKTTECSAACPQGNGTQAETEKYAQCLQDCVNEYYYSTSVGTPTGTGAAGSGNSGSASASVTAIVSTVTSGSSTFTTTMSSTIKASGTSTATGSSASSSSSGSGGDVVFRPGSSYVGLLGAIAAVLAL